jgi:hypothetical protein
MKRSPVATAVVLLATFLVGSQLAAAGGGPDEPPLELRLVRCTALRTQYEGQIERVASGKDPPAQLLAAARELTDAEVGLVASREAQVAALQTAIARLGEAEQVIARLVAAGRRPPADAERAAAERREVVDRLKMLMAEP